MFPIVMGMQKYLFISVTSMGKVGDILIIETNINWIPTQVVQIIIHIVMKKILYTFIMAAMRIG